MDFAIGFGTELTFFPVFIQRLSGIRVVASSKGGYELRFYNIA